MSGIARPACAAAQRPRKIRLKVSASSLRKGNVVDLEGKLYVVLQAQNIHPGKGTPVTQLDMRRRPRRWSGPWWTTASTPSSTPTAKGSTS